MTCIRMRPTSFFSKAAITAVAVLSQHLLLSQSTQAFVLSGSTSLNLLSASSSTLRGATSALLPSDTLATSTRSSISSISSSSRTSLSIGQLFDFLPKAEESKSAIDPQRIQDIKAEIKSLSKGTSNGIAASDTVQSQISDLVAELESANPTPNPTTSAKLDGSWMLVYTTNGGSSAGKLGPFVGEVEQLVRIAGRDEADADYINYVRIGGGAVEGALTATWDVLSEDKWQVNFESVKFKVLGFTLADKELSAVGIWRMTYLDDDFRILYAAGGKNVPKENIYILAKEE